MKSHILSILCFCAVLISATSDDTNDLLEIKRLLRIGVNIDSLDNVYKLGLIAAVEKGQSNVVEFLIDNGANISATYNNGNSPWIAIYQASFNGHDRVVETLIKHGADVNVVTLSGSTPLNAAAYRGYQGIVEQLINAEADINFPNNLGRCPVMSAVMAGHADIVALLLNKGADVNIVDNEGSSPLHAAVEQGSVEIVATLRRNNAIIDLPDGNNKTSIDIAISLGNQEIIDILVPPKKPWQKLHAAARKGDVPKIKELLENGTDVNILDSGERTPLFTAAAHGHFDAVKVLIEHGADKDKKNKFGRAPLMDATMNGHYNVVEVLAQNGALINIRKYDGWTPLNMAAKKGYLPIVELLLSKGASVNIQTFGGETPLYSAAMAGHKDVVEILIQHGAGVDIKEDGGEWSPLMRAVENGFEDIVKMLVENKANAFLENKYKATPWSIARNKGNSKIMELLKKAPRIAEIVCRLYGEWASPRIFGAVNTADGEFPWMAALVYFNRNRIDYKCSGTLISDQFVLTAAHCTTKYDPPKMVRLGKASLIDYQEDTVTAVMHNIQNITVHPGYDRFTRCNDLALIRVSEKVPFNDLVWPACLHTNLGDVPSNEPLTVAGWGMREENRPTRYLKDLYKVNLTSISLQECKSKMMSTKLDMNFFDGKYCAHGSKGACKGDSGGPLQYLKTNASTIVGVVSLGDSCGNDIPGIYTRVAYYLDWIEDIVWGDLYNLK